MNVAVVAPDATVTLAGTIALKLSELRLTTEPPIGAGPSNVRVPVDVAPPAMLLGESVKPDKKG